MFEESSRNLTNKMYKSSSESSGGESSSLIWLVLFSGMIVLSLLVNFLFFSALVCSRKLSRTHLFLFLFFLINLVEYVLLVFEFSLGPDIHFPYREASCSLYQVLLQGNHTHTFCRPTILCNICHPSSLYPAAVSPPHHPPVVLAHGSAHA